MLIMITFHSALLYGHGYIEKPIVVAIAHLIINKSTGWWQTMENDEKLFIIKFYILTKYNNNNKLTATFI